MMRTSNDFNYYSIDFNEKGWFGRCPVCLEMFEAANLLVTQHTLIQDIRYHVSERHGARV